MALVKFSNGNSNRTIDSWSNNLFESLFTDSFISDRMVSRVPAVNIAETADAYEIELAAPGLERGDFKINVDRDVLTVSAEKKHENVSDDKKFSKREYSYTSFARSFTLPDSIDHGKIDATYQNGVLKVTVGKREEAKVASRLIEVK